MAAFAVVACSDIRAVRDGCEVADPGDVVIELLDRRHTWISDCHTLSPNRIFLHTSNRMSLFQMELVNVDVVDGLEGR
jgi:hypothetical protein